MINSYTDTTDTIERSSRTLSIPASGATNPTTTAALDPIADAPAFLREVARIGT